jgi:YihY family inner membrane protein
VFLGVLLVMLNLGVTVLGATAVEYGVSLLGVGGATVTTAERLLGYTISFGSIWTLLFFLYRYVLARSISVRTAVVGATFAACTHESLKFGFSRYATDVANYGSILGNITTVAVFFFWIYYEVLVFILGGEVGQVSTMRKAGRVRAVSFEGGA